jgi:hypothetical protein
VGLASASSNTAFPTVMAPMSSAAASATKPGSSNPS